MEHNYKKGIHNGYVRLYVPKSISQNKCFYISEHRYVMEQFLGRKLTKSEHIHHINHDKLDNRIENLEIISPSEHSKHHIRKIWKNKFAGRWAEKFDFCIKCNKKSSPHASKGICKKCNDRVVAKKRRAIKGQIPKETIDKYWAFAKNTKQFFDFCIVCKKDTNKHLAKGFCIKCYYPFHRNKSFKHIEV